jgi:riboflavin synthase
MFNGIVSALGRVTTARPGHLGISDDETARHLHIGGSIAVNGCCLTVTEIEGDTFFADVVPETLRRTNLGALKAGDPVNLELPMRPDQGLDGHLVQGHVDTTARIVSLQDQALGREVIVELPDQLAPYVVEKGSIAMDGMSLTVAAVRASPATFTIALIPHTLERTTAQHYAPGTLVNLEADVVARYVHRLVNESRGLGKN